MLSVMKTALGPRSALGVAGAVAMIAIGASPALAGPARITAHRGAQPPATAESPVKLAHSRAHGLVLRSGTRAEAARPSLRFAAPAEPCGVSCAPSLAYHGGEVMRKVKMYLILWEPPSTTSNGQEGTTFEQVPAGYVQTVSRYLENVAAASGTLGNVYSVDALYGESKALGGGEYSAEFGGTFRDEDLYPERKLAACPTPTEAEKRLPPANQPCIADGEGPEGEEDFQLSEELLKFLNGHKTLTTGLKAIYFMLTPPHVNTCSGFEGGAAACSTNYYCAYHSAIPFVYSGSEVIHYMVYANMPYDDVPGCETPAQPNGSPADDEINTLSHEDNEAVTDPLFEGWYDYEGQEVADKCTYPFFDPAEDESVATDAYGPLLGGSGSTAYNQEINGGHYLLQREWSNAAGGCVTRAPSVRAAFNYEPSPPVENVQVNFAGTPSRTEAGQIVSYEWEFGDPGSGSANTSSEVDPTHIYAAAGTYDVRLTVTNDSGVTTSTTRQVTVEAPASPPPPVTTTTTTTTTVTTRAPEPPVAQHSSNEIAKLVSLPVNGERLAGLGKIALGHAECPPACSVTARIRATVRSGKRRKDVWIGRAHLRLEAKQFGDISIRLNGKGRKLLSRYGRLKVELVVVVGDREGASWRVSRSLTLTSAGKAASERHPGRHGHAARRRA